MALAASCRAAICAVAVYFLAAAALAAQIDGADSNVRAAAAYEAAASALALGDAGTAEIWLDELERVEPFPREMDGLPEIIRSDIAATGKDWDAAIALLEPLVTRETLDAGLRASLGQRIQQLDRSRRLEQLTASRQAGAAGTVAARAIATASAGR